VDVSVKNEPSIEHDMLGSDDFYNYFGGLVSAVTTHSGGQKPSFIPYSANKERPETFSLHEEASKVMRARINNPKWIAGLKQHGYKGAQDISEMTDIVFGWDATTGLIDDWMYKAIADRYAFNEENAAWIRSVNIYAMQNITERLLEAISRGMWNASPEDAERLRAIYMAVEGDIEGLN
jgi:cobaltochelatase CobN